MTKITKECNSSAEHILLPAFFGVNCKSHAAMFCRFSRGRITMMVMDEVSAHNLFHFCTLNGKSIPEFSEPWENRHIFAFI